jgi:hypothetical protein
MPGQLGLARSVDASQPAPQLPHSPPRAARPPHAAATLTRHASRFRSREAAAQPEAWRPVPAVQSAESGFGYPGGRQPDLAHYGHRTEPTVCVTAPFHEKSR